MAVFVESWAQPYGSPYGVADDDEGHGDVAFVEDGASGGRAGCERGAPDHLAFIDGTRRGEAALYEPLDDEVRRGVAGAYACGAAVAQRGKRPAFEHIDSERLLVWNGGGTTALEPVGGWSWQVVSLAGDDLDSPLREIHRRMRRAEGQLAEDIADSETIIVADGPLNFSLRRDHAIVGFVKRHERRYLPPADHAAVAHIAAGERTTLFRIGAERYSCYLRLTDDPRGGPWAGIVRLEFLADAGLERTQVLADALALRLPRYAGIPHRDPRAPQNLQPIGALETYLRRYLGSEALAERAVRDAAFRSTAAIAP